MNNQFTHWTVESAEDRRNVRLANDSKRGQFIDQLCVFIALSVILVLVGMWIYGAAI